MTEALDSLPVACAAASPEAVTNAAPAVSVIIPTYNSARLIHTPLDSLLEQTCDDFEVIASDDGSTDDTARVLADYSDRLTIRRCEGPNGGPAAARNRGIAIARGTYVLLLDHDDSLPPNSIRRHLEVLETEGTQWATCDAYRVCDGNTTVVSSYLPKQNAAEYALLHGMPYRACFYTREAIRSIGGYNEDRAVLGWDDWDIVIRLLLAGVPFSHIAEPLYSFRIQPESLSKSRGVNQQYIRIRRFYQIYLKQLARSNPEARRAYADRMWDFAFHYARTGAGWRYAVECLGESVRTDPLRPLRGLKRALMPGTGRRDT